VNVPPHLDDPFELLADAVDVAAVRLRDRLRDRDDDGFEEELFVAAGMIADGIAAVTFLTPNEAYVFSLDALFERLAPA
jgi:hypothetical protein